MSKEKSINICRASQIETEILVHHKSRIRTNIQVSVTVSIKKTTKKCADSSETGTYYQIERLDPLISKTRHHMQHLPSGISVKKMHQNQYLLKQKRRTRKN
jgi:hypothetical protein